MRHAANTIWTRAQEAGVEGPELIYPYVEEEMDLAARAKALDAKIAEQKANGRQ